MWTTQLSNFKHNLLIKGEGLINSTKSRNYKVISSSNNIWKKTLPKSNTYMIYMLKQVLNYQYFKFNIIQVTWNTKMVKWIYLFTERHQIKINVGWCVFKSQSLEEGEDNFVLTLHLINIVTRGLKMIDFFFKVS